MNEEMPSQAEIAEILWAMVEDGRCRAILGADGQYRFGLTEKGKKWAEERLGERNEDSGHHSRPA